MKLVAARTDELEGEALYRVRSAKRVATGIGRSPLASLAGFEPEIVHVHNLFPNLELALAGFAGRAAGHDAPQLPADLRERSALP